MAGRAGGETPRATPLARRVAAAHAVSLSEIRGTGPLGRITRADVLAKAGIAPALGAPLDPPPEPSGVPTRLAPTVQPRPTPQPPTAQARPTSAGGKGDVRVLAPTRGQAVVARRMVEAATTIPHFQVQTDVVMDAAILLRSQINKLGEVSVSLNDLVIKAAAVALRDHPMANASYQDGHFELYSRVNVGVAVAAATGLVVPTIFDADRKTLGAIAREAAALASRVRDESITPPELADATFTISNLGMFGMTAIIPVINPPQACILGVGALRDELVRQGDEIVTQSKLTLTLSGDHRILNGADAARFLSRIRELLERPFSLAL